MGADLKSNAVGASRWRSYFPRIAALLGQSPDAVSVINGGCSPPRDEGVRVCHAAEANADWTTQYTDATRICSLEMSASNSYNFKNPAQETIGSLFLYPKSLTVQLYREPKGSPLQGNFIISREHKNIGERLKKLLSHLKNYHNFDIPKECLLKIENSLGIKAE